ALPRLFALDAVLEIRDGHHYVLHPDARTGRTRAAVAPGSAVTLDNERRHQVSYYGCGGTGCGGCGGGCGG
ncbi:MAG: hypothetical protein ACREX8_17325, partial [Gammaproteobacteria bacterium]